MSCPLLRALAGLVFIFFLSISGCSHDLEDVVNPGADSAVAPEAGQPDLGPDKGPPDGPVVDFPGVDVSVMDALVMDASVMDAPVMDAPLVDQPVADAPVTDAPLMDSAQDLSVLDQKVSVDQPVPDLMLPDLAPPPDITLPPDQNTCVKAGDPCDDHQPCTYDDKCVAAGGPCKGTGYDCTDNITCTDDICLGKAPSKGGCSNPVSAGMCRINGYCKKSGDTGSSSCAVCDPTFSQYGWAPAKGSNCVLTFAGSSGGYADGSVNASQFSSPTGVAVDSAGVVYVADWKNQVIRKIDKGQVSTLAGTAGAQGVVDGPAKTAKFYEPFDLDVNSATGEVFVAQVGASSAGTEARIRLIKGGQVSTYAGGTGSLILDSTKLNWRFWKPKAIAMGLQGKVYAGDTFNHIVTEIWGTQIKLLAGVRDTNSKGQMGFQDGPPMTAKFHYVDGLALGPGGVLYVADKGNSRLRKIVLGGNVSTVLSGLTDVADVAVDMKTGMVYFAEGGLSKTVGNNIYVCDPIKKTKKLVAGINSAGFADGPGASAAFYDPRGLAVDNNGFIYVADRGNYKIRVINPN